MPISFQPEVLTVVGANAVSPKVHLPCIVFSDCGSGKAKLNGPPQCRRRFYGARASEPSWPLRGILKPAGPLV